MTNYALTTPTAHFFPERYYQSDAADSTSIARKMITAIFALSLTGTGTGVYAGVIADPMEGVATSNLHLRIVGKAELSNSADVAVLSSPELVADVQGYWGLNVSQLAEIVGVSRPTIYNWKKGKEEPNETNVNRLVRLKELMVCVPQEHASYLGKYLKRTLPSGGSLAAILSDPLSDQDLISNAYEMLKPAIVSAIGQKQRSQDRQASKAEPTDLASALEGRDYPGA